MTNEPDYAALQQQQKLVKRRRPEHVLGLLLSSQHTDVHHSVTRNEALLLREEEPMAYSAGLEARDGLQGPYRDRHYDDASTRDERRPGQLVVA